MNNITLHVTGHPRAQPRGRHNMGGIASTTGKAKPWKQLIELEAKKALVDYRAQLFEGMDETGCIMRATAWLRGALCVDIDWYFDTPEAGRWGKPHTHKPDRDNLDKLTLDAMVKGGLLDDDKLVAQGRIAKWWAPKAGLVIVVRPAEVKVADDDGPEYGEDWGRG